MLLQKLRKPVADRDRVVIIEENGTADIATVYGSDDTAIYAESAAQDYAIPFGDVKSFVGIGGRIFVLNAESDYVRDTTRLAALEQSIVLKHITHFEKPKEDMPSGGLRIRDILLYGLIFILVLAVIFK